MAAAKLSWEMGHNRRLKDLKESEFFILEANL